MSAGPEYPRPTKRLSDRDRASMLRVDQAGEFGATRIYATAARGPRAAMAGTAAVETEIDRHSAEQLDDLGEADPELSTAIADFQAEEVEHRDAAIAHGAEQAPAYPLLSGAIRLGCRAAIALSKRI